MSKPSKTSKEIKSDVVKTKSEPTTMAELMSLAGSHTRSLSRGDEVKGTVTQISAKGLLLDIGGKAEGLVAESAYIESKDFIKQLKVGDEITARVIVAETPEGYAILSLRDSMKNYVWDKIIDAYKNNLEVTVTGRNVGPSGIVVDVMGTTGFIPKSQLGKGVSKDSSKLVDTNFKAKILEIDEDSKRIVLSEKHVSEKEEVEASRKAMEKIKKGEIYEGIVTTVTDFGCFVEIDAPSDSGKKGKLEGLVHVSEMSWEKTDKPQDVYVEGDTVKVKVLGKDDNKLSLSMKQVQDDPWKDIGKKYSPDQKVKGKVVKISDFGAFVQLEPGVEGLIHITKLPPGQKMEEGKEVNVYVEEVDVENKKISLGLVLTAKPLGYK